MEDDNERCMQEALVGAAGSGRLAGAGAGEMGAGLQIDDTGAVTEVEVLIRPGPPRLEETEEDEEEEDEEMEELDTAGGVNWPLLLSELMLSRVGDDFFFIGFTLALLVLCCCCRHLARLFLNQT